MALRSASFIAMRATLPKTAPVCYRPRVHPSAEPPWIAAPRACRGAERVSLRSEDLDTYSHDLWPRRLLGISGGQPPPQRPQAVAWPLSAEEVQAVLRLCSQHHVPLTPFGAGSGVAGGVAPAQGGLVL